MPPRNKTGMKTATSDVVMEMMVNAISRAPSIAARMRVLPISKCRTMFSSITMASSTTNPTASVIAMSERLSTVYPSSAIDCEGADQRERNRDTWDDCCRNVPEKDEDH